MSKRRIFDEMIEGIRAMKSHRQGKSDFWNGQVSKALEHLCELKWLFAQGDHVEKEIAIFCTARFFDGKLHRLSSGDDKVLGSRSESLEKFEKVGS